MVFSKVFIVLQNSLAVILIALAIVMEAQMRKTQNRPMHCDVADKFNLSFITMEDQAPLKDALEAAKLLAKDGIDAEVINVHTIKPIDKETVVASAGKTGAVLTVENHNVIGGLHSAVLEALAKEKIPACAVGVQDRFGEVGKLLQKKQ